MADGNNWNAAGWAGLRLGLAKQPRYNLNITSSGNYQTADPFRTNKVWGLETSMLPGCRIRRQAGEVRILRAKKYTFSGRWILRQVDAEKFLNAAVVGPPAGQVEQNLATTGGAGAPGTSTGIDPRYLY